MPPIPDTIHLVGRLPTTLGLLGQKDSAILGLVGRLSGPISLSGQNPPSPLIPLLARHQPTLGLVGQATPLRPAVNVTCRVVDNGDNTWTYDFTLWNYTAAIEPYAAVYVSRFGLATADSPSQASPSEWSDGPAWRHNDPTGGGLWYGQLVAGEQDPDDLTVPTVWSASWDGRLLEGRAINGFRITLPSRETEFVWQAYANGYEAVYPGTLPGASRKFEYGAWFGALWPESVGVSEAYWEYAWNGTVEPEE